MARTPCWLLVLFVATGKSAIIASLRLKPFREVGFYRQRKGYRRSTGKAVLGLEINDFEMLPLAIYCLTILARLL